MKLKTITNFIIDLLFPRECLGCREENTWLCNNCLNTIPLLNNTKAGIIAVAPYNNELLRKAIYALKYSYIQEIAEPLGGLLLAGYKKSSLGQSKFDFIIPIPLHKKRLKERGFNQARLIVRPLANYLHCPLDEKILIRQKNTVSQMTLGRKDRLVNTKNAFAAREKTVGKRILLVDDVITTGSTLRNATEVLKKAGASQVVAIVLARDELKNDDEKISK